MKYSKRIVALVVGILVFSISQANTEQKWWEKALSVIKQTDQNKVLQQPSVDEIGIAFKEALRIGSESVVSQLSNVDGFNADAAIHIPLPDGLISVKKLLAKVGMSQLVDDLELKLNRAAEAAIPKASKLFLQSIDEMTFDDVKGIYEGPENSATEYFQHKMSQSLSTEMRPIIEQSLSTVGAIQTYNSVMSKYQELPFVPDVEANLTNHVVEKGMAGVFHYLAKEEAAIRKKPVKQTTELLKKVFGAK